MKLIDLESHFITWQESQMIRCPHCHEIVYDPSDGNTEIPSHNLITYWGEEGPITINCEHCDLPFEVEERVERTFEIKTITGDSA